MTEFNAVLKKPNSSSGADPKAISAYNLLPAAKQDCEDLRKCMKEFDITDEQDIYTMDNTTEAETQAVFDELDVRLKQGRDNLPRVNYLIICLFAGHGVLKDGM